MNDPIPWLIWYGCVGLYTVAYTVQSQSKINHFRAAILWPMFWLVVAFSNRRKS